jgi:hypothetical protein
MVTVEEVAQARTSPDAAPDALRTRYAMRPDSPTGLDEMINGVQSPIVTSQDGYDTFLADIKHAVEMTRDGAPL